MIIEWVLDAPGPHHGTNQAPPEKAAQRQNSAYLGRIAVGPTPLCMLVAKTPPMLLQIFPFLTFALCSTIPSLFQFLFLNSFFLLAIASLCEAPWPPGRAVPFSTPSFTHPPHISGHANVCCAKARHAAVSDLGLADVTPVARRCELIAV